MGEENVRNVSLSVGQWRGCGECRPGRKKRKGGGSLKGKIKDKGRMSLRRKEEDNSSLEEEAR